MLTLLEKIANREARIAVVGLGYVGLPLATLFAEAGFIVVGIEFSSEKVSKLNAGESYIDEIPSSRLRSLVSGPSPRLRAVSDYEPVSSVDAVVVCVPTPLDEAREPDMSHILSATEEIAARIQAGTLVVLESTTYPGTTEEIILPRLQSSQGQQLIPGTDFFLAYSPERIDPGSRTWTVANTPKVVGGVAPECLEVATALYASVVEEVVPVSSPKVGEMAKLLENTFRATNIALVNEIAIMCHKLDIDVWEVIEAAQTKPFGYMAFYPGPGPGGHCIPIDPEYLAWKLNTLNYTARFVQLAQEINFSMPVYVRELIVGALGEQGKTLEGARLLVLGVAYKPDVGDIRESPAIDLIELLTNEGAIVEYNDPYIPTLEFGNKHLSSLTLEADILQAADCVVVVTNHSSYDWEMVVGSSRLVIDTRNATRNVSVSTDNVVKL